MHFRCRFWSIEYGIVILQIAFIYAPYYHNTKLKINSGSLLEQEYKIIKLKYLVSNINAESTIISGMGF